MTKQPEDVDFYVTAYCPCQHCKELRLIAATEAGLLTMTETSELEIVRLPDGRLGVYADPGEAGTVMAQLKFGDDVVILHRQRARAISDLQDGGNMPGFSP